MMDFLPVEVWMNIMKNIKNLGAFSKTCKLAHDIAKEIYTQRKKDQENPAVIWDRYIYHSPRGLDGIGGGMDYGGGEYEDGWFCAY